LKKFAKFTGDIPLHVCQVKPRLKPTNPPADPCPSLVNGLQAILNLAKVPADAAVVPGLKTGIEGLLFVIDVIKV